MFLSLIKRKVTDDLGYFKYELFVIHVRIVLLADIA